MGLINRRTVLIGTAAIAGGIVIGVKLSPNRRLIQARELVEKQGENLIAIWVKITQDNKSVVIVPHSDMGQGTPTALAMMLAEELEADWGLVDIEQAPAETAYANNALAKGYLLAGSELPAWLNQPANWSAYQLAKMMDLQTTGGSSSIRATGEYGMRVAGAAVKEMLIECAAEKWGVSASTCRAEKSFVYHNETGQKLSFGELAEAAAEKTASPTPKLKDPSDFKLIGTPIPRRDIPAKVDGTVTYGLDVVLPGMKVASIKASPVFGGSVQGFDPSKVLGRRGVDQVVDIGDAVAVVADNFWRANEALGALDVTFDGGGNGAVSSASIYDDQRLAIAEGKQKKNVSTGDLAMAMSEANLKVEMEFRAPYLAHAQMEPLNCTAHVKGDGTCEVWVGAQDNLAARAAAANALGIDKENVTVHPHLLGGGFGRRSGISMDFVDRAVRVAAKVDGPVKVVWSREEDTSQGAYRPQIASQFEAGLDQEGRPTYWVNTHVLNEEQPAVHIPYDIPVQAIASVDSPTHVPYGVWRSVASSQHGYFIECFVDVVASKAGKDPLEFRRNLLGGTPRFMAVLDKAAEMAGWGREMPEGHALGIALKESFETVVAEVAEVSLEDGTAKVHKVWCAADPGRVINPDGFRAQIEGGIIFGLTAALYGEILIEEGRVQQSNFHDYEMVKMADCPDIEIEIIESDAPTGGGGEPGTPPIAPAVCNAIYALTGQEITQLPLKNYEF